MSDSRRQSVETIFRRAVALAPAAQGAFLDQACCADPSLRPEVESLLSQASDATATFVSASVQAEDDEPQIIAHYSITGKLGQGAMGTVYRATDTKLSREVAIKVLPSFFAEDAGRLSRFAREAKVLASLNHPNIAQIYGIEESGGVRALVMELVPGRTLDAEIKSGPIPLESALKYATQIAGALEAAHEKGIIHRDLKPANIMIRGDGTVKLLDFGLAKALHEPSEHKEQEETLPAATQPLGATMAGAVMGTAAYMSPEQAQGLEVDERTDIWALGVVIYEMVAGQRPFQGSTLTLMLASVLRDEPDWSRLPASPKGLAPIVRRALTKDRRERYATAGAMAQELKAVQESVKPKPRSRLAIGAVAALLVVGAVGAWYAAREYRARWARDVAIPQIEKFIASDDYLSAFDLAQEAEKRIPNDARLAALWPEMSRVLTFETDPPGAEIFYKEYAAPDSAWRRLGVTPLNKITVPQGYFEWKFTKAGYEELHFAARTPAERLMLAFVTVNPIQNVKLDPNGIIPAGMVRVSGGTLRLSLPTFGTIGPYTLDPFFIDRYEVTNREFKQFVDRGGYRNRDYWKEPFQKDGRMLTFEEAMNEFRDSTGQPGPATWELGTYKEGQEDFPVSGVSWYEAAAYAEFANKKLPTVVHWYQAASLGGAPSILPFSNFNGKGPAHVGQYQGISGSGAYDMAGNVKEWTSNGTEDGLRFTLGGAWSDPSYSLFDPDARSAFDRSAANGFRCARYPSPPPAELTGPVHRVFRDFAKEKPVSDELFRAYKSHYSFEPSDLNSSVEAVTDSSPYWRVEKVTFQAGYENQRMAAYLFLPRNSSPPYNPVVYFPGQTARHVHSSADIPLGKNNDSSILDFVIRSGRAVLYPVYKNTYERYGPLPDSQLAWREERVHWVQEAHRSVDYLATRQDIDMSHLAYYGFSMGSLYGPILVAFEPRFQTAIWLDGGLHFQYDLPECDPFNFLPRIKIPVLMVNGGSDFSFRPATQQAPMFHWLGTPEKDKRHVVFDGSHGVIFYHRNEAVREILAWLDKYAPMKK
jgi:serine/threonine protein kinase/cephalosporin-C deacetylase-like acetyl esterase